MIAADDSRRTLRFADRYVVQPDDRELGLRDRRPAASRSTDGFNYRSDNNDQWLERRARCAHTASRTSDAAVRPAVDRPSPTSQAVAAALRSDWLTTGPQVDAVRGRPRRPVAGAPCVAVDQRHGGAAHGVRGGRASARRRGGHHADDVRGDRLDGRHARRQGRLRRRRGGHGQPRPGRGRGGRSPHGPGSIAAVDYAGHPAEYDDAAQGRRRAPGRCCWPTRRTRSGRRTAGRPVGIARRPHDVLVLPDEEPDHRRGRRGRLARPGAARAGARAFRTVGLVRDRGRHALPRRGRLAPGGARVRPELPAARRALRAGQLASCAGWPRSRPAGPSCPRATTNCWPTCPGCGCRSSGPGSTRWHLYPVRVLDGRRREVYDRMRAAGIGVQVNYIPVYWHPVFEDLGYRRGMCPVAEALLRRAAVAAALRRPHRRRPGPCRRGPAHHPRELNRCTTPTTSTATPTCWPSTAGSTRHDRRGSTGTCSTAGTSVDGLGTGTPYVAGPADLRVVRADPPPRAGRWAGGTRP